MHWGVRESTLHPRWPRPAPGRWRLSLYSQLEVITAKVLGGFVPSTSSPTVVMLLADNSTRALFYLPKRTGRVLVVGPQAVPSLFEQASVQASMPAVSRQQPCWELAHVPTGSADAVVSLGGLASAGGASDLQAKILAVRAPPQSRLVCSGGQVTRRRPGAMLAALALAVCSTSQEACRVLKPDAPLVFVEPRE